MISRCPIPGFSFILSDTVAWRRVFLCQTGPERYRLFMAIFLLGSLARLAVNLLRSEPFAGDPDAYRSLAETLGSTGVFGLTTASGDVIPTAFRPPLYPYLLSWLLHDGVLNGTWISGFHSILGGLTAGVTFLACSTWLGSDRGRLAGILAAFLVIVDPILVQQSGEVMTETLATALASMVIWWWVCNLSRRMSIRSAAVLGGLLAIAYLCRPTFIIWAGMLVVGIVMANAPTGVQKSRRLVAACLTGAIVLTTVSLWTLRNFYTLGHPIWATSHGGYTLLLGNNPLLYSHLRENGPFRRWDPHPFLDAYAHRYEADSTRADYWFQDWVNPVLAQPELSARLTEHDDDQVTYRAAQATIRREPGMFLASCLVRIYQLWTPLPHRTDGRSFLVVAVIGSYYCLLYLAAGMGLKRIGNRIGCSTWWPLPTLVLTLTLVHAVYWSNMRMRAPAIPAIAMLAAASITIPARRGS